MLQISSVPAVIASLCCLTPVVLVLLGLSTVSFASSLADTLYGDYKWYFRVVGIVSLLIAAVVYLRRVKGICSIDQAKKRRNEVINIISLILISGVVAYLFFLYVVVHVVGAALELWKF